MNHGTRPGFASNSTLLLSSPSDWVEAHPDPAQWECFSFTQQFLKLAINFPLLQRALICFLNDEQSSAEQQQQQQQQCKQPLSYPSSSFFSSSMFLGKINSANVQIYRVQPHGNLFQGHMNSYYLKPFTVFVERNKVHFPIKDLKPFCGKAHVTLKGILGLAYRCILCNFHCRMNGLVLGSGNSWEFFWSCH